MKAISVAGFLIFAVLLAATPAIVTIWRDAYPDDGARRTALAECTRNNPGFNRLLAKSRAGCYARQIQAAPAAPPPVPRRMQIARLVP